ncbi:MAG TPA: efflux RND transporter permease subunit [Sediminibacterium sp.]|nr:efflux RND transporter permease subunit [Sediminibacterium sp.]
MSEFFIKRPIVAMIISIFIVIVGLLTLHQIPVSKYPNITPPVILVSAGYTGVNAVDIEQAVTTPIEQHINGVENMLYIKSTNFNGASLLEVSFGIGTNLDIASMQIQNNVSRINSSLPAEVTNHGMEIKKSYTFPLLLYSVYSPANLFDASFINNYSFITLTDEIKRIKGVGEVSVMGSSEYAMRIWLKPDKLAKFKLIPADIASAIKAQNCIVPGGAFGDRPNLNGITNTYTTILQQRLVSEEQFKNIIIRSDERGATVRLKDVATVELGLQMYDLSSFLNGNPCAVIAVYQVPEANGLDVARRVQAKMEELKSRFPHGLDYKTSLDTTEAISAGIDEVLHTLFEAVILVIFVVFLFLQNWRATLIPLLAIPVSLIGTLIVFPLFDFSVNELSLLGMVLAIGLIVDDALEIVEAVIHEIEHGLSPIRATQVAMKKTAGAVIMITLIRFAIFLPLAFSGGTIGKLYQQFAITLIISVAFSAFISLTLSPALAVLLLKPKLKSRGLLNHFFKKFNYSFEKFAGRYIKLASFAARKQTYSIFLFLVITVFAGLLAKNTHSGFIPEEDEGYFMISIQLPDAASMDRTEAVTRKIQVLFNDNDEIKTYTTINGFNILTGASAPNTAMAFISLKPWHERKISVAEIITKTNRLLKKNITEADVIAFGPPSIQGLGNSAGFSLMLQDRKGNTPQYLEEQTGKFIEAASKRKEIGQLYSFYRASVPQKIIEIDKEKTHKLGISSQDVNGVISAYLSGSYINNFNSFGRQYRTYIQADAAYRMNPEDISQFFARSSGDNMISLGTLAKVKDTTGPAYTNHFNIYRSAEVLGLPAKGFSSSEALNALEETAKETLPASMAYEWTNTSYQEKQSKGKEIFIVSMVLLFIFLLLVAHYESWRPSLSILLGTSWVILGVMAGIFIGGAFTETYVNNFFAQIGLMIIIGLNVKNTMLIIEFARMKMKQEKLVLINATIEAARLRFRPTLMTSIAFTIGIIPLVLAKGAGSEARKVMGVSVFSGTIIATIIGVILTPAFFIMMHGNRKIQLKEKDPAVSDHLSKD